MGKQRSLQEIADPRTVVTAIDSGLRFPEIVPVMRTKYVADIRYFADLVRQCESSADLLGRIRSPKIPGNRRMSLLKVFRRCVSGVCDTEATKKIRTISTRSIVDAYGHTFKPLSRLVEQFATLTDEFLTALAVSVGEYDNRGKQGYVLTGLFFDWFAERFGNALTIEGPKSAGPDIEFSTVVSGFSESCPCDFVIRERRSHRAIAVGFARYDSTRGGAQSDDRTGGNAGKVYRIRDYSRKHHVPIRILFLADGPGLTHKDTWKEACELDRAWDDNVRVVTLKLAPTRVTLQWLRGR